MPMTFKNVGALILGSALICGAIFFLFFYETEIRGPDGWPSTVKLYRTRLRGETRAVDTQTGETLFMYLPEYDMHVHPVNIQKIDSTHWQVIFEDPKSAKH
jgi:hypothetical protein